MNQWSLQISQAVVLPLLTCVAILFTQNVCCPSLSNNTCFRLTNKYQMGLEGNTTVGRQEEASNAINHSLQPQCHYWWYSITIASVQLLTELLQPQSNYLEYYYSLIPISDNITAACLITDSTTTALVQLLTVLLQPQSHYWHYK
jgi:hypothetical protein